MIDKNQNNIVFTPTKHAEKPDKGFVNKSKNEPNVIVPYAASNEEIFQSFELAFLFKIGIFKIVLPRLHSVDYAIRETVK